MAQVLLLKIGADGLPLEMTAGSDDITLASYTVTGGGPVLSSGLDMNNGSVSDAGGLSFTDPATDGITQTAGLVIADDLMAKDRNNTMTVGSDILFPVVTDTAGELDGFATPQIAGVPSATPTSDIAGTLVYDSSNKDMYVWDGDAWDNMNTVTDASGIFNSYTADEALAIRDFLYISAADNVSKVDPSASGTSRGIGFAVAAAIDTATVSVQSNGIMGGFSSLTAGAIQYADPSNAGLLTETVPVGAGNVIVQAGYAKSTTALHIQIQQLGKRV